MRKSRFSEKQIGVLKEHQAGLLVAEICRRHRISAATFYAWRPKYGGGLEVSDVKRLKVLEEENPRFEELLAEQMLGAATAEAVSPKAHRLMADVDAALEQHVLDLPQRDSGCTTSP